MPPKGYKKKKATAEQVASEAVANAVVSATQEIVEELLPGIHAAGETKSIDIAPTLDAVKNHEERIEILELKLKQAQDQFKVLLDANADLVGRISFLEGVLGSDDSVQTPPKEAVDLDKTLQEVEKEPSGPDPEAEERAFLQDLEEVGP